MAMGRIRTKDIKKMSFTLIKKYPERFSADFETNKKVLQEMKLVAEKRVRNKVAGYVTHRMKLPRGP